MAKSGHWSITVISAWKVRRYFKSSKIFNSQQKWIEHFFLFVLPAVFLSLTKYILYLRESRDTILLWAKRKYVAIKVYFSDISIREDLPEEIIFSEILSTRKDLPQKRIFSEILSTSEDLQEERTFGDILATRKDLLEEKIFSGISSREYLQEEIFFGHSIIPWRSAWRNNILDILSSRDDLLEEKCFWIYYHPVKICQRKEFFGHIIIP